VGERIEILMGRDVIIDLKIFLSEVERKINNIRREIKTGKIRVQHKVFNACLFRVKKVRID
jgi:hypothetical protein